MTKQYILKDGKDFIFVSSAEIIEKLEPGIYTYGETMFGGKLTIVDPFEIPEKIYKNDADFINHVIQTYKMSDGSLGILLTGKKGLGKSFTAREIIRRLNHLPTIQVGAGIEPESGLISTLNSIKQEHIVFIDEFGKIFKKDDRNENENHKMNQEAFLSYLDGNGSEVKRLFIITSNEEVNEFLMNRPSRLRYVKHYDEIAFSTVEEIIVDKLQNKEFQEDLLNEIQITSLNVDILIKIIEEINLHNKPYSSFKEFFNYTQEDINYDIVLKMDDGSEISFYHTINNNYFKSLNNPSFKGNIVNENHNNVFYSIYKEIGKLIRLDKNTYELPVKVTISDRDDKEETFFAKVLLKKITFGKMTGLLA